MMAAESDGPELEDFEARLEHMRILLGELATFADIPLPSPHPGDWDEYQRTARLRLDQIAQLCRAAAQFDTLPLSVEACIAVVKACNAAGIWYQPDPGVYGQRRTADEIDAAELAAAAAARPLRIVAILDPNGRDSGRTVLERGPQEGSTTL